MDLKRRSIEIILNNQHSTGAYVACPNFETYRYCWLRDGSFIAHSMDIAGECASSRSFFDWVDRVITSQVDKIYRIFEMTDKNEPLLNSDFLPTRYNLDGSDTGDEWPNFQLDGYGTWLWALCEHMRITGNRELAVKYTDSIKGTVEYLLKFWSHPNYDCWEENGDKIHPSTLACIYGGLNSIKSFMDDKRIQPVLDEIKEYIIKRCTKNGRLVKYEGSESVDASLLWAAVPFKVLSCDDDRILRTVREIENYLNHSGGVHRYPEDSYYGGGEWPLLSCWLGLYYCEAGRLKNAEKLTNWAEASCDPSGEMPEQVLNHVNNPVYTGYWKDLWGDAAKPLLWSHAMYIILLNRLKECTG